MTSQDSSARPAAVQLRITTSRGELVLPIALEASASAADFSRLLPLNLSLRDYAGTEMISDLPRKLTMEGAPRGHVAKKGDLCYYAPWGNLALFYKDFGFAANLVLLGRISVPPPDGVKLPAQARIETA